jgi:Zn-dependent peptidase ImmA (M78 family)
MEEFGVRNIRYILARDRARGLLLLTSQRPPVDIDLIIEHAGVPVVERGLAGDIRATIGDVAGRRSIILNRNYRMSSAGERRWILAEELGHIMLGHRLVNSTAPGTRGVGLLEARRVGYEREARAFAAELLMPFREVSDRWFALLGLQPEAGVDHRVKRLAADLGVTRAAMRVRLRQMRIIEQ